MNRSKLEQEYYKVYGKEPRFMELDFYIKHRPKPFSSREPIKRTNSFSWRNFTFSPRVNHVEKELRQERMQKAKEFINSLPQGAFRKSTPKKENRLHTQRKYGAIYLLRTKFDLPLEDIAELTGMGRSAVNWAYSRYKRSIKGEND